MLVFNSAADLLNRIAPWLYMWFPAILAGCLFGGVLDEFVHDHAPIQSAYKPGHLEGYTKSVTVANSRLIATVKGVFII